MAIILKNAIFINWENLEFSQTNIKVNKGDNGGVEFKSNINDINILPTDEVIDCEGKIVTKSFAVGHHHAYSALSRGMPVPKKSPINFLEILKYIWWNIDKALNKEMIEASALATAVACAKAGNTFVIDHHASPNYINGSLDIIADAFEKVGISHLLCYEISDRDGSEKANEGLKETDSFLTKNQGLVGLHASFTVGDPSLKKAVKLMEKHNSGIHIHVAEDTYDQQDCIKKYNKKVVERLNDFGVLNSSKTILAHCLHISDDERNLIKNSKAYIVQNTESNLNNNVGYFNSKNLGENIILGTDGMHSDMIRSTQMVYFVGQANDNIDFSSAYKRLRKIHYYISKNNFIGDGENNLVILDYNSPTKITQENFIGHFIFGFNSNNVHSVISGGEFIVKNKILQKVDEEEIMNFAREQSVNLWSKL